MIEFIKYLFEKKAEDVSWFKVIKCRFKGHPHGVIWYTDSISIEPDMTCINCGDNLG